MQSLNDDERKLVLGEVLADELRVILEYVKDIPLIKHDVAVINSRLDRMESKMGVIEAVARGHDRLLSDHGRRISKLEARPA